MFSRSKNFLLKSKLVDKNTSGVLTINIFEASKSFDNFFLIFILILLFFYFATQTNRIIKKSNANQYKIIMNIQNYNIM